MDLFDHFRIIYGRRWQVLVASLAIAALVFVGSSTREPVYEATTLVSVTSGRAVAGNSVTQDDTLFLTRNYAELAETRPVLAEAASRSGLPISPSDARTLIRARAASDVGFLTISAEGPSPGATTSLAKGAADALIATVDNQQQRVLNEALGPIESEITRLEGQLAGLPTTAAERAAVETRYDALIRAVTDRRLAPVDRLQVVSDARADIAPVRPKPARQALLAFLVALVVNAELAVLYNLLKDRFSSTGDDDGGVTEATGLPVLARVPSGGDNEMIEAFRALRTSLMFLDTAKGLRSVAVVSPDPGAGRTFTCVNLALSVSTLDVPVVLVDADLRRPRLHQLLEVNRVPGLADVLGGADLDRTISPAPKHSNLAVIAAGSPADDPAGMLAASQFSDLLTRLDWAGMVIVDTPATSLFSDALPIASRCDCTILVVDAQRSRRRSVRRLTHQLERIGANTIGIVLNRTEAVSRGSYSQYSTDRPDQDEPTARV